MLQVIYPGETAKPGTTSGKSGTPTSFPAGGSFNVTINITDVYWNVAVGTDTVLITTTDPNDTNPGNRHVDGSTQATVMMVTAGNRWVEATSSRGFSNFLKTHAQNNPVNIFAGTPVRLQIIMPGQIAQPGTSAGKSGLPAVWTAGVRSTVTVNACDAYWNIVTATNPWVELNHTDSSIFAVDPSSAQLTGGSFGFMPTLVVAGTHTVIATAINSPLLYAREDFTVSYGAGRNLQVLAPGEIRAPGTSSGKTGAPIKQTAGVQFSVGVNLVDNHFNIIVDTNVFVTAQTSDSNGTIGIPKTISGSGSFNVTNRTAWFGANQATHTVTATATGWTQYTSSPINLKPNIGRKLQVLLPGETADPGTNNGKRGTPHIWTAGVVSTVTVNAVDKFFNIQKSSNPQVRVSATDQHHNAEAPKGLFNGTANFWVRLNDATNDPWQIIASTAAGENILSSTSSLINVSPAAATRLLVLLPGETANPGSITGKKGSPTSQTAGVSFPVIVNAVDNQWNRVIGANPVVTLWTDNNYPKNLPMTRAFVNGTTTYDVILRTAEDTTVTAIDNDGVAPHYSSSTSTVFGVNPAAAVRLQILVPGENANPGSSTGKKGSPSPRTAGVPFKVTVNAVDPYFNINPAAMPGVTVTTSDIYDIEPSSRTLTNGTTTFTIDLRISTITVITARDTDGVAPTYTLDSSPGITVNPNTPQRLLIVAPGEVHAPGHPIGKSVNTPIAQTAGAEFNVVVHVTDKFFNTTPSTAPNVSITLSDTNSIPPANKNLTNGTTWFAITFRTAGTWNITANNPAYIQYTSPGITVNPAAAVKLLIILPGETYAPGSNTGKIGTPAAWTAGVPYRITVRGVDANWNINSGAMANVQITTEDPNDTHPADVLVNGVRDFNNMVMRTAGSWRITATDIDGTPLISYITAPRPGCAQCI